MDFRGKIGPDIYVNWRGSKLGAITESVEDALLLELLGNLAGQHVLDVGCGDGTLAVKLWRRGARVIGIDANPKMVEEAVARSVSLDADVRFAVANGEQLPFVDATFDTVLAKTVLCFVEDAEHMAGEIARVLHPGGRFVIGELGKWSLWAAQRRMRAWFGSQLLKRGRFRTPGELRGLASSAGLDVHLVRGAVYYPRCMVAARLLASREPWFSRRTALGAAFLAMSAAKPMTHDKRDTT